MQDVLQVWKSLTPERRLAAGQAFYNDENLREFQRAADTFIARLKNLRPQFVKRLPVEKRAHYLAVLPVTAELAGQFLVSYHFAAHRPMMAAFLDALGIKNENGLIDDAVEAKSPSEAELAAAVAALKRQFAAEDVELYLATLVAQSPEAWGALAKHLPQPAA